MASTEATVSTMPSANIASCEMVAASQTPTADVIICQKPSSAEAAPAFSPNGESACALPSGLTIPMPSRKTPIAARNAEKGGTEDRDHQNSDAAGRCRQQGALDRTVEPLLMVHTHDEVSRQRPLVL